MATQKQMLAVLQNKASLITRTSTHGSAITVTIRKNSYGEYEARLTDWDNRASKFIYFASDFKDAHDTLSVEIDRRLEARAKRERQERREYSVALQTALDQAQTILNLVGCRIEIDPLDTVTMYSPKTGKHSLCMRPGVRPVSDLIAHVCGFAEAQTHIRQ